MPRRSTLLVPYLAAIAATVAAAVAGNLLGRVIGDYTILYVTFFAAVTFAAWYGGLPPALLTTALSYLIGNLYFINPDKAFVVNTPSVTYLFACMTLAVVSDAWRRARRRAQASAEHVASIVETIADGFIAIDNRWRCTHMNRAAEELNHLHRRESIGRDAWDFFPLTSGELARTKLRQAAAGRIAVEFESFYEPLARWFEVKASPADDGNIALFFRDVTERKLAQMALSESEERLRLAQHGARAGLWDWDMVTGRVIWSDQYYVITGLDRSVKPSRNRFLVSVHPDDRSKVKRAIGKALREHKNIDIQYRTASSDAGVRWIAARGRTTVNAAGKPIRASGIVLDITERKKAEESLRFLSEAGTVLSTLTDFQGTVKKLAELAVEHFADWCVVDMVNSQGRIECVALAHRDPARLPILKELLERYPLDWNTSELRVQSLRSSSPQIMADARQGFVDAVARDDEHRRLLGQLDPLSVIVVPMVIRDQAIGTLCFVSSESRRRYSAADLELATELARRVMVAGENARLFGELKETQRQKDDFLAMLAHELRNPLAAISYANEVSKITDVDHDVTADTIDRQVANLSRLLDDLLDVSRITRDRVQLKREFTDGAELVRRAVATLKPFIEERRHKLVMEVSTEPMPLYVDPIRIEQILGNLLTNAIKYTPEGGMLTVRACPLQDHAVFTIKDTGLGISPAMLPRIFELFVQVDRSLDRSQGGLGVGLTLVRKLAEMHGGSVSAKSDGLGMGSDFTIRLPLCEGQGEKTESLRNQVAASPSLRVLIVDDNADLAESVSQLLTLSGHTVAIAHDGFSAIDAARNFGPNVVLLDLGLPGLDGYRVAETLRREPSFAGVRFIAISGYGQPEDRKRTREAGFDHHLVKPVKLQALLSILTGA